LHACPLQALPDDFGQLHNLQYLNIDLGANRHRPTISKLPDSFSGLSNLTNLTLTNFKDLHDMPSSMIGFQMLWRLTWHSCPLQALPDDFGRLHNLEELNINLGANHHKPTISKLPDSFSGLSNLTELILTNFKDLHELPSSMIGLQRLRTLTLHACPLQALPNDFGRLHNLHLLNIDLGANHHKPTISKLPDSFLGLSNLTKLILTNFKDMHNMPPSMKGLQRLRFLTLHACPLQALPDDFGRLHNLEELDIDLGADHHKPTISKFPDSFSGLSNLTKLILTNFKDLHDMPSPMMGLQQLHTLTLHACPLQALPDDFGRLHSLQDLYIDLGANHHRATISKLPDSFSGLSNLTNLTLKNFKDLHELPLSITGLVMLHHFEMCYSTIQSLPSYIKHFTNLMALRLEKINSLQKLPNSLSSLKRLRNLDLVFNRDLIELPNGFGELQALTKLNLHCCSIKDIARRDLKFGQLTSLTRLNLKYNRIVISPKILEDLSTLQYLNMSHCRNLTTIEGLPKTLEVLDLGACRKLAFIPSIAILKKLTFLSLCNCEALKHLYDLESLEALKEVNLSGCSTLQCSSILSSNVVLERCYLSGSSVFILYDNDWRKVSISFITLLSILINLNLNP
jgi:Leucine-rich repeat (LRR) protein